MAYQSGLTRRGFYSDHISKAADFVVAHGPSFGAERWEEQGGFSPSTIAAEIAGLVAAGRIADLNGDTRGRADLPGHGRPLPAQHQGLDGHHHRALRHRPLLHPARPRTATPTRRSPTTSATAARTPTSARSSTPASSSCPGSASCRPTTPTCRTRWPSSTHVIRRDTDSGAGFYRYGTATPGTEDGYGDCYEPRRHELHAHGKPWPHQANNGSGHLWPVLTAERAEQQLQTGERRDGRPAAARHGSGSRPASGWSPSRPGRTRTCRRRRSAPPRSARRSGSSTASAAGSASPLTWAQAPAGPAHPERRRGPGRSSSREIVRERYQPTPPAQAPVHGHGAGRRRHGDRPRRSTSPAPRRRARPSTSPSTATDGGGATTVVTVPRRRRRRVLGHRAGAVRHLGDHRRGDDGRRRDRVRPTHRGLGLHPRHTGARRHRPVGDDNGPGTYAYPTVRQLQAGRVRPAAVPGLRLRRQRRAAAADPGPDADLRLAPGRAAGRRLRARPRRRHDVDRAAVREPQLHDRRRLGVEPPDRGAGLRQPGLRRRRRRSRSAPCR